MSLDAEILIIGAGMSGLGLAVQIVRKFGVRNFELIEKSDDLGGTWWVNQYPGCGCDVASHFYSYSFELNPDWSRKFSMRQEIQQYFNKVAKKYEIIPHIRFHSTVETAQWDSSTQTWTVDIYDAISKKRQRRRCKILISAVGSLSVPRDCEIPGASNFKNPLFHSAKWNHSFDWKDKDVVVIGNGCSATQFVPVMSEGPSAVKRLTQFSRQPHYLSERQNPYYSNSFKNFMRYVPLAMRLYRAYLYWDMEKDFAGFPTEAGRSVREGLARENVEYVQKMAPEKYWEALIPKYEIGCKRKVLDTDYLACLHRPNVELVPDDPVQEIFEETVRTKSGREIHADAIVLATGFQTHRMLSSMEIRGEKGMTLNEHWDCDTRGAPQAYLGASVDGFPNFFILMGPNTVTGHLSVIYTVECQINFVLRVIDPIIRGLPAYQSKSLLPSLRFPRQLFPSAVTISHKAAKADTQWIQSELKKLVWSSGCTNWALDPETNMNIMMYPNEQYWFWWRSVFFPRKDFEYRTSRGDEVTVPTVIWGSTRKILKIAVVIGLVTGGIRLTGITDRRSLEDTIRHAVSEVKHAFSS